LSTLRSWKPVPKVVFSSTLEKRRLELATDKRGCGRDEPPGKSKLISGESRRRGGAAAQEATEAAVPRASAQRIARLDARRVSIGRGRSSAAIR
jgi:hypothetical protein